MKHQKLWIFAGAVLLVFVLNRIFGWSDWLSASKPLDFLNQLVQQNLLWALLLYTVLTIVACVVLALPGVTFAILAGVLFGPWLGTLVCSVATTVGAMIAFVLGRFFLKESLEPVISKNKYLKKWLFDNTGRNQVFVLMITRLVPIFPYNLQNFAYGITSISFGTYAIASFLFMLPGTAMYTVGAAGLTGGENSVWYFGIAALLAVVVMVTGFALKKKYFKEENNGD